MIRSGRYFALVLLMSGFASIGALAKAPAAATSSDFSIVLVDMEKLLKPIQADFEKERDSMTKEFQVKMEGLQKKKQDHDNKKDDVKDKIAHAAKGKDIDTEIQVNAQSMQARMMSAQQIAQKKAEGVIAKVDAVRAKHGWSLVMPKGAALAHHTALDKTDDIMKEIK